MSWIRSMLPAMVPLLVAAAPNGPPDLDVVATCHARDGADEVAQGCIRDERAARDDLQKTWARVPAAVRERCVGEVRVGGSPSYVELLTCFQMDEWSRQPTPAEAAPSVTSPGMRETRPAR